MYKTKYRNNKASIYKKKNYMIGGLADPPEGDITSMDDLLRCLYQFISSNNYKEIDDVLDKLVLKTYKTDKVEKINELKKIMQTSIMMSINGSHRNDINTKIEGSNTAIKGAFDKMVDIIKNTKDDCSLLTVGGSIDKLNDEASSLNRALVGINNDKEYAISGIFKINLLVNDGASNKFKITTEPDQTGHFLIPASYDLTSLNDEISMYDLTHYLLIIFKDVLNYDKVTYEFKITLDETMVDKLLGYEIPQNLASIEDVKVDNDDDATDINIKTQLKLPAGLENDEYDADDYTEIVNNIGTFKKCEVIFKCLLKVYFNKGSGVNLTLYTAKKDIDTLENHYMTDSANLKLAEINTYGSLVKSKIDSLEPPPKTTEKTPPPQSSATMKKLYEIIDRLHKNNMAFKLQDNLQFKKITEESTVEEFSNMLTIITSSNEQEIDKLNMKRKPSKANKLQEDNQLLDNLKEYFDNVSDSSIKLKDLPDTFWKDYRV